MRLRLLLGEDCGPGERLFFFFLMSVLLECRFKKKKKFYTGNVHQPRNKMCDKLLMVNVNQISLYHLVSHPRVPRTHSVSAGIRIVP